MHKYVLSNKNIARLKANNIRFSELDIAKHVTVRKTVKNFVKLVLAGLERETSIYKYNKKTQTWSYSFK